MGRKATVASARPDQRLGILQPTFAARRIVIATTSRTALFFTDVSLRDWLTANGLTVMDVDARFMPLTVTVAAGDLAFLVPLYPRLPLRPMAGQMLVIAERR